MKEDESNWFSKWEDELPSPEELMPLSQTLISPDLALAFNIRTPQIHHHPAAAAEPGAAPSLAIPQTPNSGELESSDFAGGGGSGGGGDEPARTLKRPRLVWTPQLHKRFVDAVAHLGIKNAVPKTIMQLMSVDGLTRENVASHLQKYRLYLKRMQGLSSGSGAAAGDPATDHLFASSPVPPHILHPGRPSSDHFMPYTQVATMQQPAHHHHLAMAAGKSQFPAQFGQIGHFGLQPNGQMDHPLLSGPQQAHSVHRLGTPTYVEDIDSGTQVNGRKALALFPTGEN